MKHYRYIMMGLWMLCFSSVLSGQQASLYSQVALNPYAVIPAYAGFDGTVSAALQIRDQWNGLEGSPEDQLLSVHLPVYNLKGALGLRLERDRLGVEANTRLDLSYNYIQEFSFGYLSYGVQAGLWQKSVDGSLLRARDGIYQDGQFSHNDPRLAEANFNAAIPTYGFSIYHINAYGEAGISYRNAVNSSFRESDTGLEINARSEMNFFALSKWSPSEILDVSGAIHILSDFVQLQTEVFIWMDFMESYLAGLGYRGIGPNSRDALIVLGGLQISETLRAVYSYDVGLSALNDVHQGSHEVGIYYTLNKRLGGAQKIPIIHNPRFLE